MEKESKQKEDDRFWELVAIGSVVETDEGWVELGNLKQNLDEENNFNEE